MCFSEGKKAGSGFHGKINLGNVELTSIKQVSLLEYFSESFKMLIFILIFKWGFWYRMRVTIHPSLPGTVPIYTCCPGIINIVSFQLKNVSWFSYLLLFSCVRLFVTPCTVARQAPQSMEFSRPEYWSGLPFLSPGDLPNPGIEPRPPTLQADCLPSEPPGKSI